MTLQVAYSPCPNDVFIFQAWARSLIDAPKMNPIFADIDKLNRWMLEGKHAVTKGSFYCYGKMSKEYLILPVGSALGFGCGPKIIAKHPFDLENLSNKIIAIPGGDTTAHLLLSLLCPSPARKIFCLYHEIADLMKQGKADCGLIIHESRFTFADQGFVEVCDLGVMWEELYGLPLPLGGIFANRALGQEQLSAITQSIQKSIEFGRKHPEIAIEEALNHSREKDPKVVQQHIDLYVNSETSEISELGIQSISKLLQMAYEKELIPSFNPHAMFYKEKSCEPAVHNS